MIRRTMGLGMKILITNSSNHVQFLQSGLRRAVYTADFGGTCFEITTTNSKYRSMN